MGPPHPKSNLLSGEKSKIKAVIAGKKKLTYPIVVRGQG